MGVMVANDIVQARFFCYAFDQVAINSVHFRASSIVANPTTAHFAALLASTMPALYKALLAPAADYIGLATQKVFPLPKHIPDVETTGIGAGALTGHILPRQTSGIVTKRTAFAGKRYRGRVYVPFPAEDVNQDSVGTPTAAYVTLLNNFKASLLGNWTINTGGNQAVMVPIIYHEDDNTYTDITGSTSQARWGTQRRRSSYGPVNPLPFA